VLPLSALPPRLLPLLTTRMLLLLLLLLLQCCNATAMEGQWQSEWDGAKGRWGEYGKWALTGGVRWVGGEGGAGLVLTQGCQW